MIFMTYLCDHPYYDNCTVYLNDDIKDLKGLSIVQERFDPKSKIFWWGPVDENLANDILTNELFAKYFIDHAKRPENGLYPTFNVRKVMWALKMRPMKLQEWEKRF